VGGVDSRTLLATPVKVGAAGMPGVIGSKPAHLLEDDEETRPVKAESMTIDIGAGKKDAALSKARPGDWAVFATRFQTYRGLLRGKALDDRLGVVTLIELVLDPPPGVELFAAFTVQEEIGLRGAKVAAHAIDPQVAFILDATPAHDMPGWDGAENTVYNTKLGAGPAVYLSDRGTIYDARLIRLLTETATAKGIPHQMRQPGAGGTDAGAIHLARSGVPCAALSVPCRSIHTPNSVARQDDWFGQIDLMRAALTRLGQTGWRR
jgi:endoglucanase